MSMTRKALLKARFDWVRHSLNEIVDRLEQDHLEWAPAEGMRTLAGQIVEIIAVEIPLVERFKLGKEISDEELEERVGDAGNMVNLRKVLSEVRQQTLDYLESLTDAELEEEVSVGSIWFGSMWLPKMPRAEIFLNIVEHEFYHVGQLATYLWARGDNPYQW